MSYPQAGAVQRFSRELLPDPLTYYEGQGLTLKGGGVKRTALCPFHGEKTPSFLVNTQDGSFHCFGCGAHGGDIIDFHQERYGMGFVEAARDVGAWKQGGAQPNADELKRIQAERETARAAALAEEQRKQAEAKAQATEIWNACVRVEDHKYTNGKGVKPYAARVYQGSLVIGIEDPMKCHGALVIPIRDASGELHSLEFIDAEGKKRFLPNGALRGHYCAIGKPAGRILIAEGYGTGASLHAATGEAVAVAFTAGGLEPVAEAIRSKYPDLNIVIAADHDARTVCQRHKAEGLTLALSPFDPRPEWCRCNPGLTAAIRAAHAVGGTVAVPTFSDAERDAGKTDFNDLAQLRGADPVRAAIEAATVPMNGHDKAVPSEIVAEHKPRPLQRIVAEPTAFPVAALGPILGAAANAMAEAIQAPLAMCGNSVMAAACLAAQARADVVIDGRKFPLSEFFVTIGESGERKSAIDAVAQWPIRRHERNLTDWYENEHANFKRASDAYGQAKNEALSAKSKGYDEKKKALDALADREPIEPLAPMMLCEEPTYEGVYKMLETGQPSIGLCSDEGGRFIGGHAMNNENALKTAAGLSGLWDGKPMNRVRKEGGASSLHGRRLALHLMMQPEVSRLMLSNQVLLAQGLLSRCLVTWPTSTAGTRTYKEIDLTTSPALRAYDARLLAMLETPLPIREGKRNELDPRPLPLATDAKRLWVKFHDAIEAQLSDGGKLAPIKGLANKAPEHAARLAGVLALVDDTNAAAISLQWLKAGIELTTHYINEALRLYDAGAADPQLIDAEKLLNWLRGRASDTVSLVEVYQQGPSRVRTAKAARELMRILEDHGYAFQLPEGVVYEGAKRAEAWRVLK